MVIFQKIEDWLEEEEEEKEEEKDDLLTCVASPQVKRLLNPPSVVPPLMCADSDEGETSSVICFTVENHSVPAKFTAIPERLRNPKKPGSGTIKTDNSDQKPGVTNVASPMTAVCSGEIRAAN